MLEYIYFIKSPGALFTIISGISLTSISISAWINDCVGIKQWNVITNPGPNFIVEVRAWMSYCTSHDTINVITYPCSNLSSTMLAKEASRVDMTYKYPTRSDPKYDKGFVDILSRRTHFITVTS